jgi:CheY-like chemotaxis protein
MTCQEVLVIDDDSGIRETLRDLLELEGFRVNTARNGFEGLQRLQQAMPCLILLDLMMPVMNGWEFLKRLQAEHHDILSAHRVAVISAAVHGAHELEEYGCPVLTKPIDIQHLLSLAHTHCKPATGS